VLQGFLLFAALEWATDIERLSTSPSWAALGHTRKNSERAKRVCFPLESGLARIHRWCRRRANKRLMRCNKIVSAPPSVSSRIWC